MGTAAAYIIFNPNGRGEIFPFKSTLVHINCGGKNLGQGTNYVIREAFWDKAKEPSCGCASLGLDYGSRQMRPRPVRRIARSVALCPKAWETPGLF